MISVHYSATARQVYIDEGTRTTAIDLPAGLDPNEVAYVLQSDTLRSIIAAIVGEGRETKIKSQKGEMKL